MKESERQEFFDVLLAMVQNLKKECMYLCTMIDSEDDLENAVRRVHICREDVMDSVHQVHSVLMDWNNYEDQECQILYDVADSIFVCSEMIDECANDFLRYNITSIRDNVVSSFLNTRSATQKLEEVIFLFKEKQGRARIFRDVLELSHYSDEGVGVYNQQMKKLFSAEGEDPVDIIRWSAVYKDFRKIFDDYGRISRKFAKYIVFMDDKI